MKSEPAPPKRLYRPPKLTVYGRLRDLTREGGSHRNKDGGNNAVNNRT